MIAEEIVARFGLEVDEAGFQKVEAALHGLHHGIMGVVGAFSAAVVIIGGIVESVGEAGDGAARSAEKIGMTTQALQGLTYAAHLADVSAESLQSGLKFLGKNAAEAAHGSTELRTEFARAGVAIYDSAGKIKPIPELLASMADHFEKMPKGAEKTNLAMKLLGRAGIDMVPLLNKGSKGIEALVKKAEELGLIMDEETIKNAEEYADGIKEVGASLIGLRNAIGGPLLKDAAHVTKFLSEWIIKNREAIASPIVKFAKALSAAVGFLASGTKAASAVWFALITMLLTKGLVALGVTTAGFEGMGFAAVTAAAKAAYAWAAATLPIAALAALIVLITDDLYEFATGGDSVLGDMVAWFNKIDPTDNPLIKAIRAVGNVLFDLTDPAKWAQMVTAANGLHDKLIEIAFKMGWAFLKSIGGVFGFGGGDSPGPDVTRPGAFNGSLSNLMSPPSIARPTMVTSPLENGMGPSTPLPAGWNAPTVNVTIHAKTGADAKEIAAHAKEATKQGLQEAHAALQGS